MLPTGLLGLGFKRKLDKIIRSSKFFFFFRGVEVKEEQRKKKEIKGQEETKIGTEDEHCAREPFLVQGNNPTTN